MVAPIKASDFNNTGSRIPLGYKGEHKVRSVLFDITDFVSEVGEGGTVEIKVLRNGEGLPYNATNVTYPYETEDADKTYVLWTITNVDTGVQGNGQCQLVYTVDDGDDDPIIKTMIYNTMVQPGIGAAGSTPNPSRDIVTELDRAIEIAQEAKTVSIQKAAEANTSAGNSATSASNSHQSEVNAAASAQAAEASKDYVDEHINDFARIDGYYEDMTVGDAEQLTSTVFVEDNTPYIFRTSGGSADISNRKYESLVGGTVSWNQLVNNGNFASAAGWGTSNGGGLLSIANGEATLNLAGHEWNNDIFTQVTCQDGHRILVSFDYKMSSGLSSFSLIIRNWNTTLQGLAGVPFTSVYKRYSSVGTYTSDTSQYQNARFRVQLGQNGSSVSGESFSVKNFQVFDLTQMFGTNIANFIYSLEQAEAGKGVAFFRKLFPKSYYPYDAGSLQSVKATGIKTTGFNQWDEEWESGMITASGVNSASENSIRSKNYIPVVPGQTYYCYSGTATTGNARYYDADKNFVSYGVFLNRTFTIPDNAHYMRFYVGDSATPCTTYNNDICINLSWSGVHNGEYEPYEEHSYDLDSNLELRGIPKLASTDEIYYDGDEYLYDGTVKRKYGIVDLGTLTWTYYTAGTNPIFYGTTPSMTGISGAKPYASGDTIYALTSKYPIGSTSSTRAELTSILPDKTCSWINDGHAFTIRDSSYSDAATFKTAMSGVYLVYELAEPTEETALSYAYSMVVNDWGTEEFLDGRTVEVPVGHETKYPANLRDKLQHLPDLGSEDGEYTILQQGTNMSLKKFDQSHKADIDGYYEDMTVGNAEQLVATVSVEDQTPYNFRTSGGSASIGDRANLKVVGGTVAWNQLFQNGDFSATSSWYGSVADITYSNNILTATCQRTATYFGIAQGFQRALSANHKYLVIADATKTLTDGTFTNWLFSWTADIVNWSHAYSSTPCCVFAPAVDVLHLAIRVQGSGFSSNDYIEYRTAQLFDLTQMFGSTIADYIYQLEQGTAGAGVAFFRKLFPLSYYPYAEGGLESVNVSSYKTTGLNQFDKLERGRNSNGFWHYKERLYQVPSEHGILF